MKEVPVLLGYLTHVLLHLVYPLVSYLSLEGQDLFLFSVFPEKLLAFCCVDFLMFPLSLIPYLIPLPLV